MDFEVQDRSKWEAKIKPLLTPDTRYTVTKFFSGGELSQELAICSDCGNSTSAAT